MEILDADHKVFIYNGASGPAVLDQIEVVVQGEAIHETSDEVGDSHKGWGSRDWW